MSEPLPPTVFHDRKGRHWNCALTIGTARKIKSDLGINLLGEGLQDSVHKISMDPALLVDTLWVALQEQADEAGIEAGEFGESFDADSVEGAVKALTEAVLLFFPSSHREAIRVAIQRMDDLEAEAATTMREHLTDEEVQEKMKKAVRAAILGEPSGSSPAE